MSGDDDTFFPVSEAFAANALLSPEGYRAEYRRSIEDAEGFWGEHGKRLDWMRPYTRVKNTSYERDNISVRWYEDGTLNAAVNCLDRHLASFPERTAIIWEGDDPNESRHITYAELHREVCRLANALKARGVKRGDRVTLYMPMVPEAAAAMLACARIGAVHSAVFGGFSPEALAGRIRDCASDCIITADEGVRGGKRIPLKANTDAALALCEGVHTVLVLRRTGGAIDWNPERDVWYHEALSAADDDCPAEEMGAEDPLFILYTSGSTGQPKGVLHTTGGYLVYAAMTQAYAFDQRPESDVFWCTADIGWVTGHSYVVYGPLANGATTLMFEGVPNWPDASRFWRVCDKHGVTLFYTAPTAIRALMREGNAPVEATSRSSLRVLGSVGEPLNPEAWLWYYRVVGDSRCPVSDTWWQTETGGHMILPLPGVIGQKPGSVGLPFFGIRAEVLDSQGAVLEGEAEGALCIADSWPGQMRTIYGDHKRFEETYFSTYPGHYFSGDGCRRDRDGYFWITGRVDDVLNVSGHRLGTAELESALVAHAHVAEAAVVGCPHDIKGQGIYAFVSLNAGVEPSDALRAELVAWVRRVIGPIATPEWIQWAPGLPKTRSGKIMRRILRKVAANDYESLGDVSTLADPSVVDDLIANRLNR